MRIAGRWRRNNGRSKALCSDMQAGVVKYAVWKKAKQRNGAVS